MKTLPLILLLAPLVFLSACNKSNVRPTPDLVTTRPVVSEPAQPTWIERTGDATWSAVTAPAKLLTPTIKPKKNKEPIEPYEPADATIIERSSSAPILEEIPAPSPPATQPK